MSRRLPAAGRWISLDGVEASGKSTQAAILADALGGICTREPGATPIGTKVRAILLDPDNTEMSDRAEALLYAADRAQHHAEVVAPALEAGRHVVSDRSWASSLAYQGYGRGLSLASLDLVNQWAMGDSLPDLVLLVDVPVDRALARLGSDRDRLEREGDEFHRRVAAGFAELAAGDPDRWAVVDGDGDVDEVAHRIRALVAERLGL